MGVYLPNMEMPESCSSCFLKYTGVVKNVKDVCLAGRFLIDVDNDIEKDKRCPLVEVPPHGKLIDGDKFYDDVNESALLSCGFKGTFNLWFDEQETIIEAEVEHEV